MKKLILAAMIAASATAGAAPIINVYKSPTCGCCGAWIKHLRDNGMEVAAHDVANPGEMRAKMGIPDQMGSCHTAVVEGYAIEGHVPAADIKRLLATKPKAVGLAVPGMPLGSPGMEADRKDAYNVYLVVAGKRVQVFKRYS